MHNYNSPNVQEKSRFGEFFIYMDKSSKCGGENFIIGLSMSREHDGNPKGLQ